MGFPLMRLDENVREVIGWLETAIQDCVPHGFEAEDLSAWHAAHPEMAVVQERLRRIKGQLHDLWTREMLEQLAQEEAEYQDLEDRHDAQA
jgi:hypothetical protein